MDIERQRAVTYRCVTATIIVCLVFDAGLLILRVLMHADTLVSQAAMITAAVLLWIVVTRERRVRLEFEQLTGLIQKTKAEMQIAETMAARIKSGDGDIRLSGTIPDELM